VQIASRANCKSFTHHIKSWFSLEYLERKMQAEIGYQFRRLMHARPHFSWNFDKFKLKSSLKMAAERLKLVRNKLKQQEHAMNKQVVALLKQGEPSCDILRVACR
jgi:hypothetical protein